jgi:endonuclease YncB( thermonuclease family)
MPFFMSSVACCALIVPSLASSSLAIDTADAKPLSWRGTISIEDADTFMIDGARIRLSGIDGPRLEQRAEQKAANAATRFLFLITRGKIVDCKEKGDMTGGRFAATCTMDDHDLGSLIVAAGFARDCPKDSGGRYAGAENDAREHGKGLWGMGLMPSGTKPECQ